MNIEKQTTDTEAESELCHGVNDNADVLQTNKKSMSVLTLRSLDNYIKRLLSWSQCHRSNTSLRNYPCVVFLRLSFAICLHSALRSLRGLPWLLITKLNKTRQTFRAQLPNVNN